MENKQSFFAALKDEVVRGLSPSRSRSKSPARTASPISALLRRKKHNPDYSVARSVSLRPLGETLTPLIEGPDPDATENGDPKRIGSGLGHWMKGQLSRAPSVSYKRSDLRLLLGVMGAPLAPVHVCATDPLPHLSIKDTPIVSPHSNFSFSQTSFGVLLFLRYFTVNEFVPSLTLSLLFGCLCFGFLVIFSSTQNMAFLVTYVTFYAPCRLLIPCKIHFSISSFISCSECLAQIVRQGHTQSRASSL